MERERTHLSDALPADDSHVGSSDSIIDLLGKSFEEKPIWAGLYESIRDALFPPRLPPLEVTSTPIPTPDRLAVKTNPWAIGTATIANGGMLVALVLMGLSATHSHFPKSPSDGSIHLNDLTIFAPSTGLLTRGGGSGGSNSLIDPIQGRTPRHETRCRSRHRRSA
jgi:hypothetical protein